MVSDRNGYYDSQNIVGVSDETGRVALSVVLHHSENREGGPGLQLFSTRSVDGGRTWREARLEEPVIDKCLTRFRMLYKWEGGPIVVASRATDSTGYTQPTVDDIKKVRAITGFVQHHNGIQPWAIAANGEVSNVIAG